MRYIGPPPEPYWTDKMIVIYAAVLKTDTELLKHILNYVGVLAAGPIGAYLYAAQTQGNKET